jgi:4-diphosphocytidyl-2-C-methyl-D-erythritol kinase
MILFPNAKLNLGLNVLAKRPDGYHNIETIFYPVPLRDILEVLPAPDGILRIHTSGNEIPGKPEDNLCVKAFHLLQKDFGISPVHIHLHKVIPTGAGLGGGSSDAAFMLVALNHISGLGITDTQLTKYASQLGSDCTFFIKNATAFAHGRGEITKPVSVDLQGYYLVIVKPSFSVDTATAYSLVHPEKKADDLRKIIEKQPGYWKDYLMNDFEEEIFKIYPLLQRIKNKLYLLGAVYASMSGSGSAMYGIFSSPVRKTGSSFPGCFVWESKL